MYAVLFFFSNLLIAMVLSYWLVASVSLGWLIRGAGLLGYFSVFWAIVIPAFSKQIVRRVKYSPIKIHHWLSVTGLVLLTIHPLALAIQAGSLAVFLPRFDSLTVFLQLGGRLAWYFLLGGALVAVFRRTIGPSWRWLHGLNYVAFLLGTVHGVMIGTDLQILALRIVAWGLALIVVVLFVKKRLQN